MKRCYKLQCFPRNRLTLFASLPFLCLVWTATFTMAQPQTEQKATMQEEILKATLSGNLDVCDNECVRLGPQRADLAKDLLKIFNDPKSSRVSQCAASFYLGEMRLPEAANDLARRITFALGPYPIDHLSVLEGLNCAEALVKIGSPAIPALIRNLAESDDARICDLSLKVLYHIDEDKDIVRLRLQREIDREPSAAKKVRLQSALNAVPGLTLDLYKVAH